MFNPFMLVPLMICLYEILSLIVPLKISWPLKILCSLILLSGLAKSMLYRRTETGFDVLDMPYSVTMATTLIFNFIIVALFMLLVKDIAFILWRLFIRHPFPGHYASLFVFSLAIVSTLYGTYEGLRLPDVRTHEVVIPGLGRELDGLKVAMLVDIHADALTDSRAVQAIVERTNSLNPDVVLIPGDFVDGQVKSRKNDLAPLSGLRARLGVFGTTGNHEYYFDYHGWLKEIEGLGVKLLMNEHVILSSGDSRLAVAGIPDHTGSMMGVDGRDLTRALDGIPENVPVILMDHQPRDAVKNAEHGIALQVSGHTHGGQMPGIYSMVRKANGGFVRGWYNAGGMRLYVSPGTSQWNGFACRIFDPSEITLFILRRED